MVCLLQPDRTAATPYGAAACLLLAFAQWGVSLESRGMYDTFRIAAMDDEPPYLVTDTERGACKQRERFRDFIPPPCGILPPRYGRRCCCR